MRKYLLTCEVVEDSQDAARRLKLMPQRVMLRIPIQWDDGQGKMDDPRDYVNAFRALSEVADVMIEFVDSDAMKHLTPDSFERHVKDCLKVLGSYCAAAEAGNEVNGDWLGDDTAEKVRRALVECGRLNIPAAVTYYLSADDPEQMFEWIDEHRLKSEYALISYYPNTTPSAQIDARSIFTEFAQKFSDSDAVGWAEYGTEDADGHNTASMRERAELIRKIEKDDWELIAPQVSKYAGFGGYWDWGTDTELDEVFKEVWK